MTEPLSIKLRPASEGDARLMAIIKVTNAGSLAKITNCLGDSNSAFEASIKRHEKDILERLADPDGLLTVAMTVKPDGNDIEHIVAWASWKVFDGPQPVETIPSMEYKPEDDEQTRLSKMCLYDFKHALAKGRNLNSAGKRNIRAYRKVILDSDQLPNCSTQV